MDIEEIDETELLFGNDDPIDKKINKDLNEIREKLSKETLSDEFKSNLAKKLKEFYEDTKD